MSRRVVSEAGKKLLKHSIKSTNSANKRIEEKLMWETWKKRKRDESSERSPKRHRPLDDESDNTPRPSDLSSSGSDAPSSKTKNYWTKKLLKAEESDTGRWNHSGFKELYPEEFHADSTSQSSCSSIESTKKKKRKKAKKKKKEKKKKKKKKKKHKHSD